MALPMVSFASAQSSDSLSVDQAVQLGFKQNPQVAGGLAGVRSALANYRSLTPLPPIALGLSHIQDMRAAPAIQGDNSDTLIDLGETFDTSGQRRYSASAANAQYKSTKYGYEETLLGLEQQIRDAYWSLAAAQAQSRIADVSLKEAQRVYDLTVTQESAGSSPKSDVIRSSIDVANARQTLLAAKASEKTALIAFNNLLARKPTEPANLTDDLDVDTPPVPTIQQRTLPELQAAAGKNRPLLRSQLEQVRAAEYAIKQTEASRLPDLNLGYERSIHDSLDTLTFSVSLPLFDFGSIKQSVRAAREAKKQAQAVANQVRQQVEQQVAQAYTDLDVAIESAAGYKKEILDPSVTLLGMAQLGYKQGATGILPIIDAESTIRNARVGYINSLLAIYKAQNELLAAIGHAPENPVKK